MDNNKIENPNLENEGEGELDIDNENQGNNSEGAEESVETLKQRNQSLYEQLKKAKGFTRDENGKWIKKQEPISEQKSKAKSNEFGYAEKAFLTASGLKGSKEFELAQTFAKETGKNLEQVLESKYFQNELNDLREIERTTNATIKGKDSKGVSIDSVEYWATKDFKDVPREMKAKVIEHNLKKENSKNVFYNS